MLETYDIIDAVLLLANSMRANVLLFNFSYFTVYQHALKSMEITGINLALITPKSVRKKSKGLKSHEELKFN